MRSSTARRTAVALLATVLLASPLLADRAALKAEIERTGAEIDQAGGGSIDQYATPKTVHAIGRFWSLIQTWTIEYLQAHPQASAREIEADLTPESDLTPSAVRLTGDAVAISIERGFHGTVFVISRAPGRPFTVAWDIRAVAEKSPPDSKLAAWTATVPGVHAGPLGGRVLALPPARSGRPRFLTDAIEHAGMGLEVPGQIGVWEWTGSEAVPEFLQSYLTTGEPAAKLQGNRLLVPTKENPRMFFTCGSCDDPQGTWTLRITPDGVTDLGHAFADPLLGFVDDLLDRVAHGRDATVLASPAGRAQLARTFAGLREEISQDNFRLGMLMGWKVRSHGNRRVVDLATDWTHLLLTIGQRSGKPYVTAVKELE